MEILKYQTPLLDSNMYLLIQDNHAVIIDPFWDEDLWREKLQEVYVDWILFTHEHYDHISGAEQFRKRFQSKVLCAESCAQLIENPICNLSHYYKDYVQIAQTKYDDSLKETTNNDYICKADELFPDGDFSLKWNGNCLYFFRTPGHSPGSYCILLNSQILFSGDTLLPPDSKIIIAPGGRKKSCLR